MPSASAPASSVFKFASSEKSVGHRYAPMAAGSSARAAREPMRDSAALTLCCSQPVAFRTCLPSPVNATPSGRINPAATTSHRRAFLVSLISTHPPDGALSRTSLRPRPRSQRSSASIASSYHDQCARARNIFILRCGTKDHVLLVPQSRQRINSGRSPCRRIASENRGA